MINDNSGDPRWPERVIIKTEEVTNRMGDFEPFAQFIELECKHWLINTFGKFYTQKIAGDTLKCRSCYTEKAI